MNNLHKSGYSSQDSYDLDIEKKDMLGQIEKIDKVSKQFHLSFKLNNYRGHR
jgi:hypothetical protein